MKKREIRKFIVMIMGIILLVSEVQLFSGDNVYASTKTSRYEQLYVPSYAAMSGKMLYYAVGSGAQGVLLFWIMMTFWSQMHYFATRMH